MIRSRAGRGVKIVFRKINVVKFFYIFHKLATFLSSKFRVEFDTVIVGAGESRRP